jgi:hypothetical protein
VNRRRKAGKRIRRSFLAGVAKGGLLFSVTRLISLTSLHFGLTRVIAIGWAYVPLEIKRAPVLRADYWI